MTSSQTPSEILNQADDLIQQAIAAMKASTDVDYTDVLHMLFPVASQLEDVIAQADVEEGDVE